MRPVRSSPDRVQYGQRDNSVRTPCPLRTCWTTRHLLKEQARSPLKCQKLAPFFFKYIFFFLAQETNDISRRIPDKICVIENPFCKFLHARDLYCFVHAQVNFIIFKYVYLHDFSFDVSNCNYLK